MAVISVAGLMPGFLTYDTRIIFYVAVVLPFLPIYFYTETLMHDSVFSVLPVYFIFYLIFTVVMTQFIKKIGKRWSKEEYEKLKPDQITFPFIVVTLVNSVLHFGIYYLLIQTIY